MPTVSSASGDDELIDLSATAQQEVTATELTLSDLWKQVYTNEDIIIVIDGHEESRVRKGLSGIKAKENAKLKDNDLPIDKSTLEFIKHDDPDLPRGRVKLQIYLKKPDAIKIHSMKVSEGEDI